MEPHGIQGYIIDFDKAKLFLSSLPRGLAKRNLDRLLRSVRKFDPEQKYFSADHWEQFLSFYRKADGRDI